MEPIDYQLTVHIRPESQRLDAVATLASPSSTLPPSLRLARQAEILSVESAGRRLGFSFENGRLLVPELSSGKIRQVTVRYSAVFNDPLPRDTVGIEDPSFGVAATIGPAGTYLSAGTAWFPRIDNQRGRHDISVSAPAPTVAVTAGRYLGSHQTGILTVSEWRNDFPVDGLALAAGHFDVAADELDGIQLLTFLSPGNADLAPGYLAALRRHLAFYRDLLGPYPYPKFAVVENFLPTGYGMPSWTLLGKSVVRLPFLLDTSLPHEIVHSWWGNAVEVDYAGGNWAEGLTTYLADYLLKERNDPPEALAYRRKLLRDYTALVEPARDFSLTAFTGRTTKAEQAIGYGKAAMVFHMLRREIGEQAFWGTLRAMAAEASGRTLGWRQLETYFAKAAGRDLRWFFAQWVERPGAPQLTLEEVRTTSSAEGWSVSGVVRQRGESYRLDLPLRLTATSGETREATIRLNASLTPFRLTLSAPPRDLEADVGSDIFRRLQPEELPATVNDLLQPRRPLVVIARGQEELRPAAAKLLQGLHWQDAEIIGESSVTAAMLNDRDVLLLGWPARRELQPALPEGLTVASGTPANWRLRGETEAGDVLFAVLSRRHGEHGTRAMLLARDQAAAALVAAKIPHYGRYSELLFATGRNLVKSTREPAVSPLRIPFDTEQGP